jgi:hypothetical protein
MVYNDGSQQYSTSLFSVNEKYLNYLNLGLTVATQMTNAGASCDID